MGDLRKESPRPRPAKAAVREKRPDAFVLDLSLKSSDPVKRGEDVRFAKVLGFAGLCVTTLRRVEEANCLKRSVCGNEGNQSIMIRLHEYYGVLVKGMRLCCGYSNNGLLRTRLN